MNITENIVNAIKAERERGNSKETITARVRSAIIENPWSEKHRNITRQCMIGTEFPDLAEVLKAHPAYTVPEMFDLLPDYGKKAVEGTIMSLRRDANGKKEGNANE